MPNQPDPPTPPDNNTYDPENTSRVQLLMEHFYAQCWLLQESGIDPHMLVLDSIDLSADGDTLHVYSYAAYADGSPVLRNDIDPLDSDLPLTKLLSIPLVEPASK